jgi:tyrosyl-tRNA synthetase
LNLASHGKIKSGCHAVFAPLPSGNPSLEEALSTMKSLKSNEGRNETVLLLPDWTARVCNKCDADAKTIDAFYSVFLTALKALDADAMKNVIVMKQSEAILTDPSNYWISVINVGRHFSLDDVMGSNMQDSDGVGIVIGRLMKIADVMGLDPASVGSGSSIDENIEMGLIGRYFDEKLESLTKPVFSVSKIPSLALQVIEDESHKTENYEYFILDDPKVNGKSKMKKAFCEPGNIDICPPIVLSIAFGAADIEIKRSPENGGDVVYKKQVDMETDFKSGALHPGDLKAKASAIMVGVLEKISSAIKEDKDVTKSSKALKAFQKKFAKKKK